MKPNTIIRPRNLVSAHHRQSNAGHGHADPPGAFDYGVAVWLFLVIVIGGHSQQAPLNAIAVQLLTMGLAVWAIWLPGRGGEAKARPVQGLWLLLAISLPVLGVISWQLLPLPSAWIETLPGRKAFVSDLSAAGIASHFEATSLSVGSTLEGLLNAIVWLLAGLMVLHCRPAAQQGLIVAVLLAMVCGMFMAAAERVGLAGAKDGVAELNASGFFANRNHLAVFLACSLPLALIWTLQESADRSGINGVQHRLRATPILRGGLVLGVMMVSLVGVVISGSRAGLLLCGLAWFLCALIMMAGRDSGILKVAVPTGAVVIIIGGLLAVTGNWDVIGRFSRLEDYAMRQLIWQQIASAIQTYWPFGVGAEALQRAMLVHEFGTAIDPTYINRAHNEYLAIGLELGLPGVIVTILAVGLLAFAFVRRIIRQTAAVRDGTGSPTALRETFLWAVPLLLLAAHSAIDYPLRTPALGILFVVCATTLLASGRPPGQPAARSERLRDG